MTPAGWTTDALGALCDVSIGRTPTRARSEYWGPGFPWLSIADMNQGRDLAETKETITETAVRECKCRLVQPGTALLSFKLSVGKVGIARTPMYTNEAIAHLPIRDAKHLDVDYLCRALSTINLTRGVDRAAMGATLNKAKLQQIQIPLPPIEEQRRIAAVLDQADELRAKRQITLAAVERIRSAMFVERFGDPATNPYRWPIEKLSSLVRRGDQINYGVVQPGGSVPDGVPLIRASDLVGGIVRHDLLKRIDPQIDASYRRSRLRGDELLVCCVGSVGAVGLATEQERGFNIARAVARIPVDEATSREFLAAYLVTPIAQHYFESELRTVAQPTLNIRQLKELPVPVPPRSEQVAFDAEVKALRALARVWLRSAEVTHELFASLQQRAFRGEL